jgi:SAM-dependent methyltransferase
MNNHREIVDEIPFELMGLTKAINYQRWVADTVTPFLGKRIIEVGAGIGNLSRWLPVRENLVITEASEQLFPILENNIRKVFSHRKSVKTIPIDLSTDWLSDLKKYDFDTVVSFNVMEHIENDRLALCQLIELLRRSSTKEPKRLISFVPSHSWLYGSMDKEFGHFRRYSANSFKKLALNIDPKLSIFCRYFNLFGVPGWFLLGRIIKKTDIGQDSIQIFEKICPKIRKVDDWIHEIINLPIGQSLLSVITLPPAM